MPVRLTCYRAPYRDRGPAVSAGTDGDATAGATAAVPEGAIVMGSGGAGGAEDGMTADLFSFSKNFVQKVSNKIINSVHGINRVVYDVTLKPPRTIELE